MVLLRLARTRAGLAIVAALSLTALGFAYALTALAVDGPLDVVAGGLAPAEVLTLAGASIVCSILMGVIISAWKPTAEQKDRFGPLLALLVGVVVVVGFAVLQQSQDLVAALLTGILVGGGSMGVHDVTDAVTG